MAQTEADYTTVSVKPETWEQLDEQKERGQSMDDVIRTALERADLDEL